MLGWPERFPVGVDLNVTHHRAVTDGHVIVVAVPVHSGRQVVTFEITVTDDAGRRTASARLTCFMMPARATGAESTTASAG